MEERPKLSENSAEEDAEEVQSDGKDREGFFRGWAELISGSGEDQEQPTRSEKFREWFRGVLFPRVVTQESTLQQPDDEQGSVRGEEYDVPNTTHSAYERPTTIADKQGEQEASNSSVELQTDDESTTESLPEGEEAVFEEDAGKHTQDRIKQSEIPLEQVESTLANDDTGGKPEKPERPTRPAPADRSPISEDVFAREGTTANQPVEKKTEASHAKESKSTLAALPALFAAEFLTRRKQKKAEKRKVAELRRRTAAAEKADGQPDRADQPSGSEDQEPTEEAVARQSETLDPAPQELEEAGQSKRHEIKDGSESIERAGKKSKKDPVLTVAYHISEVIGDKSKDIPSHRDSRSAKSSPKRLRAVVPQHTQAMSAGFIIAVIILAVSMAIYLSA